MEDESAAEDVPASETEEVAERQPQVGFQVSHDIMDDKAGLGYGDGESESRPMTGMTNLSKNSSGMKDATPVVKGLNDELDLLIAQQADLRLCYEDPLLDAVDNLAAEVETLNDYLQIIVKREMDKKEGSM